MIVGELGIDNPNEKLAFRASWIDKNPKQVRHAKGLVRFLIERLSLTGLLPPTFVGDPKHSIT